MTYKEATTYLFDSVPMFQNVGGTAYKEGLSNTLLLDEHFGHPHRKFRTIHVGGTNGKGSCSHTSNRRLQSGPLYVTSPDRFQGAHTGKRKNDTGMRSGFFCRRRTLFLRASAPFFL